MDLDRWWASDGDRSKRIVLDEERCRRDEVQSTKPNWNFRLIAIRIVFRFEFDWWSLWRCNSAGCERNNRSIHLLFKDWQFPSIGGSELFRTRGRIDKFVFPIGMPSDPTDPWTMLSDANVHFMMSSTVTDLSKNIVRSSRRKRCLSDRTTKWFSRSSQPRSWTRMSSWISDWSTSFKLWS